jgi:iron complex transport system ATP-binding protein
VVLDKSGLVAKGSTGQVMTQEMMNRIYKDTCQVKEVNGLKIMVPGTVDTQPANVVAFPGNSKGIRRQ